MYWPASVPKTAIRSVYMPLNGNSHDYYVWARESPLHAHEKWAWYVLGNNGFSATKEEAAEQCRRWIRDKQ